MNTKHAAEPVRVECYGFWRYDCFPYVLGGEGRIIKKGEDYREGCFMAKGYDGAAFANPVTMRTEKGREIHAKLRVIQQNYETAKKALDHAFLMKAKAVAPFIK